MSGLALALILIAAVAHATWNLLAKKAGGDAVFVWLCALCASVLYAPLVVLTLAVKQPQVGWAALAGLAATASFHTCYFILLQRGYRKGDLSLVYPLARSTGPLLSSLGAIALLSERPSRVALLGALLVLAGVGALTFNGRRQPEKPIGAAIGYGVLTGLFIAAYTLVDKVAVSRLHVPPILQDWGANFGRTLLLLPYMLRRAADVRVEWRSKRRYVLAVAALIPFSYILVLTAMAFTPVSYVAPARELGILFGTLLGARVLGEGHTLRRLIAGGAMVAGVIALALG